MSTKAVLLTLAAVLTLSVAYYFAIALPRYNQERLSLERQKYADEQKRSATRPRCEKSGRRPAPPNWTVAWPKRMPLGSHT